MLQHVAVMREPAWELDCQGYSRRCMQVFGILGEVAVKSHASGTQAQSAGSDFQRQLLLMLGKVGASHPPLKFAWYSCDWWKPASAEHACWLQHTASSNEKLRRTGILGSVMVASRLAGSGGDGTAHCISALAHQTMPTQML